MKGEKVNLSSSGKNLENGIKNRTFNLIPNYTKNVTIGNFDEFKAQNQEKAKVLLFTDKTLINPLIKTMSNLFKTQIIIGIVESKQNTLLKQYGITAFPTLV